MSFFNSIYRLSEAGPDWSANELVAYNILVQREDAVTFFGGQLGSIDDLGLDPNLLSPTDPTTASGFSKDTYRFLAYLDLASHQNLGQESAIHDFAKSLLEVTGFDELGTTLCTRLNIPFTFRGDSTRAARADLCLVYLNSEILLVLQADQAIARAIAAFHTTTKGAWILIFFLSTR